MMKCFIITLFTLIMTIPSFSQTDSTFFDARSYADEIDLKYLQATDIKGSYMKKNLFENVEDKYSMLIDSYFDGDYVVLVDSYENDNGSISDNEFFFREGKLVYVVLKLKTEGDDEYIMKKCYYFEQMMVLMIDENEKEHRTDSIEFKKVADMISWRVTEIMDLLNK